MLWMSLILLLLWGSAGWWFGGYWLGHESAGWWFGGYWLGHLLLLAAVIMAVAHVVTEHTRRV